MARTNPFAAVLLLVPFAVVSNTVSGVSVLNKLGDHWEFADDWDHFPQTAPLFPHLATRWPRDLPPESSGRTPALTIIDDRHPLLASVPLLPSPRPLKDSGRERRKKAATKKDKRNVVLPIPVYEYPIHVEVPVLGVAPAGRHSAKPVPAIENHGNRKAKASSSAPSPAKNQPQANRNTREASPDPEVLAEAAVEAVRRISTAAQQKPSVATPAVAVEVPQQQSPAATTPVQRIVRQDFGAGDFSGSAESFSGLPGPAGYVGVPQSHVRYSNDRPRIIYSGGDDYGSRGGHYQDKAPKYEFGYVAKAIGRGKKYGGYGGGGDSGSGENGAGYGGGPVAEFGHRERRDGYNTQGAYFVDLPDGRRQRVDYYVNGDSGFVAKVAYSPVNGGGYGGRVGSDSLEG